MPAGDGWLGPRERAVLAGLRFAKRRDDWRLGRWTAKTAVAAWLDVDLQRVEILAAADGAPEAFLAGVAVPVSVSLSHRGGRALAVVADAPAVVGCDLEVVEPRSAAFVREWLAADDPATYTPLTANLLWTAKEAAAKVRREGLRLDVRRAVVEVDERGDGWRALSVAWAEGITTAGWWRDATGWVMTIAGAPPLARPRRLAAGS
ncbi:MAG TPA: 4'-phosphopantetheinyl transferase superfamily protein [Solirubrobacteraceae bacterium]|nr:4'-phosphopantetheinyl transferase superfamily protein [Solirubrobacteraceae bacterium]